MSESTYPTCEAAVLTLLRAYASSSVFTTANAKRNDWTAADAEGEVWAVVDQAGDTLEFDEIDEYGEYGMRQERHEIGVYIGVKVATGVGGAGAADATLQTLVSNVKDWFRRYERLNNATGVRRAQITRTSAPIDGRRRREGAPQIVFQRITLQVNAQFEPTVVEQSQ